jgi:hypothetical protein
MTHSLSSKYYKKPLRLLVETGDGRSASAILENDFLRHCLALGAEVHVLSPGACFEPFVERYHLPGTSFSYLSVQQAQTVHHRRLIGFEKRLESWLTRFGLRRARHWLWKFIGERANAADAAFLNHLLDEFRPDCFVTAHLNQGFCRGLIGLCCRKGIPTIGNVFSWDHPFYRQSSRPDWLTCWSTVMRDNLVKFGGFLPGQIEVIGAPVFDLYFDPSGIWTRQEFCDRIGLDPARPILLFATLGQMQMFWDETGTFRAFLQALDQAALPGPPQVVLRLHPISVDYYFDEFRTRKDLVFSRYSRYCPGMRWCPSRDEIIFAGNLLRHADVCISPGSTMTIETAIFDTPTIVPAFNPIMPEEYEQFFRENWLNKHFRFLVEEDTICLVNSPDELIEAVRRALADRTWLTEGRRKIREHLLGPLDGRATERLARVAVECASQNAKRR